MALVDFMDESSEMYMEARNGAREVDRMDSKIKTGEDAAKAREYERRVKDHMRHTNNKDVHEYTNKNIGLGKNIRDPRKGVDYDTFKHNRSVQNVIGAMDAMERHDRRHKHEGAIELI